MRTNPHNDVHKAERAWGIVQNIDLIGRDLTVRACAGVEIFDIPPDCPIFLHGEPIKLRLVQPHDHVCVTYQRQPQRLIALKLDVQPKAKFSGVRL